MKKLLSFLMLLVLLVSCDKEVFTVEAKDVTVSVESIVGDSKISEGITQADVIVWLNGEIIIEESVEGPAEDGKRFDMLKQIVNMKYQDTLTMKVSKIGTVNRVMSYIFLDNKAVGMFPIYDVPLSIKCIHNGADNLTITYSKLPL